MRGATAREMPEAVAALSALSGRLDVLRMRQLNERVEVEGQDAARVAAEALAELGLAADGAGTGVTVDSGRDRGSWLAYLWDRRAGSRA
ncbi:MAG: glycine betaine ABC transporter substrate-binding protein [Vicinamibacterales bacterium]